MDCFTLFSVILALGFSVFPLYKKISFFNLCSLCCIMVLWFVQNCFGLIQVVYLGCTLLFLVVFRLFSFVQILLLVCVCCFFFRLSLIQNV